MSYTKGGKDVAVEIRKDLKKSYPNVKFSVTSDYSKVVIKYNFGVSEKEINSLCSKYELGHYDYNEEYYKNDNRNDSIPQCQYIFVERSETWNELQKLAKYVSKTFNVEFNSNVRNMIGYRWLNCLNDIELIENEDVETMYNRVRKEAIRQGLLCVCDDIEPMVETSSATEVKQEVETKEVKTSSDTEVKTSKWDKLNKEFDEKMSSVSDDEFSNWIDNNEVKMSVENVVEKMIESSNAIGCDIEDDIQADEIVSKTQEMSPQVTLQCPNCYSNNTVISGEKDFTCVKCGVTHELYNFNSEIKVLNITDENIVLSKEHYNTKVEYNNVDTVIEIKDYKKGYIINGTTNIELIKQKLNDFNLNRYVKIGIEIELSEITETRSIKVRNYVQCFVECGSLIERLEDIVSEKSFIQTIENEKIEIGDVICLLKTTIIIISEKRNCIILL